MTVRVNKTGRVAVRGTTKIGGRKRTVLSAAKRARRAGVVELTVRLTKAGRAQLARSGRLRVSVRVRLAGVAESEGFRALLVSAPARRGG